MAFKSAQQYNEEKYGGLFRLQNDGDCADVIPLYQSEEYVLVADVHYIKTDQYSGYVHCTGRGCPCCGKGIRIQTKLFVPLYNVDAGEIQFFDRSMKFQPQLHTDVFAKFPNPSEYVFRITRKGVAGDINTRYEIVAVGNNGVKSYADIMSDNNSTFPDYYENICKDVDAATLSTWLSTSVASSGGTISDMPNYTATPRASAPSVAPLPTDLPDMSDLSMEEVDGVDFN